MKRRLIGGVFNNTRSKKPRLILQLSSQSRPKPSMVSATHVHNFMVNDTLVDWLKVVSRRGTRKTPIYGNNNGFSNFLFKRGIEFESRLIEYLKDNGRKIVSVSEFITDESCEKTKKLMREGVPILHSVPVKNNYNRTQGIIDLLVRSDYIDSIVNKNPLTEIEQYHKAPRLNGNYHYVVIDIKFSTLPLRADSIHLLNTGHYPAYKAQTYIYTQAVGMIQGYVAPYAFILGRRWKYKSKNIINRSDSCLDRLGKIDFSTIDKPFVLKTKNALKWVRDVKENGTSWSINPPSRKELYPNMCVDSGKWNHEKKKIAIMLNELTTIWNVGVKHRNIALENGVTSWKSKLCSSSIMNINGKRSGIIDKIISINNQNKCKIIPQKIESNVNNWKEKSSEVFVDFETLSDIFSDFDELPRQKNSNIIFMIGVGWDNNGIWNYRNFICKSPNLDEEYRIMNEFMNFLNDRGCPKIHYWHAEKRFWNSAENRQYEYACKLEDEKRKKNISECWQIKTWNDLYYLFRSEPIIIKGCFNFGLKNIANAMRAHRMITSKLDSDCTSGMTAMIKAWQSYQNLDMNNKIMIDIEKYNEFDCNVLYQIINYLRSNHC